MQIPKFGLIIALLIVFCCRSIGQLSTSQIDSLKDLLPLATEDTNQVNLLMQLGNEVGYTDLNEALNYAQRGLSLSEKIDFEMGKGRLSYLVAITYMDLGEFQQADSMLTEAKMIFELLNDQINLAKIDNALGNRHYMAGNYLLAANYYSEAAERFEHFQDSGKALISYQNLVSVLGEINQHEKAAELGKKILMRIKNSPDPLQLGYTLQGLATELIYSDRLDEVTPYIKQLLDIGHTTEDQNLSAEIFSTLATYYYQQKEFNKAIEYFEIAKNKAEKLDYKFQVANHLNSLGNCFLQTGKPTLAKNYLNQGLHLAQKYGIKNIESKLYLSLSKYYKTQNNDSGAYLSLLRHTNLSDSLLNAEVKNQTMQLEVQYESSKKDREISQLRQTQLEKDFSIRRRNTYLSLGASIILLLGSSLYISIGFFRNRQELVKQQNLVLEEKVRTIEKENQISSLQSMINGQESERTRIARDLHDGLGGIFSTVKMLFSTLPQETPIITKNTLYQKTLDLINEAADELRIVAHNMMPDVLMKLGLVEALKEFCNNVSSGRLLKITFQSFGMDQRLNSSTEIMLYRIVQELVNNIIKHAQASEAIIQINRQRSRLSLIIEDNGSGFDAEMAGQSGGMGIEAVKNRVAFLNGKVTIDSRNQVGTTVMIDLLINEAI
jgi:signal transduction histidine kinase